MTQWRLHEIFSKFGTVTGIVIRRSGGQAVTVGVAIPSEIKGPKDRFYASIEFRKRSSVKSALRMDGKKLDNVPIVVSVLSFSMTKILHLPGLPFSTRSSRNEGYRGRCVLIASEWFVSVDLPCRSPRGDGRSSHLQHSQR